MVDHDLGGKGDHQGQKARVSVQIRKVALMKERLFSWPVGRLLSTFPMRHLQYPILGSSEEIE